MSGPAPTHVGFRLVHAYAAPGPVGVPGTAPTRPGDVVVAEGREQWVPQDRFEATYRASGALDFPGAMHALLAGQRIARKVWRNGEVMEARDGNVWLHVGQDTLRWRPHESDYFATDWSVLP